MGKRLIKKKLKVDKMTCIGCEARIENEIIKMDGVYGAEASYTASCLTVTYSPEEVSLGEIIKTVEKLGYKVRREKNAPVKVSGRASNKVSAEASGAASEHEPEKGSNSQLITMGILIAGIYLIIKNTIGFNFIPQITPNMGYGILFLVGMLSSIHCVAMCGGINLSLCVSYKFEQEGQSKFSKFLPSFLYNGGRILSYTVIGGIVGALGSVFTLSNAGSAFITIIAGTFMVIMGLNMLNVFPALRKLNPHMPKLFANKIHSAKNSKGPFVVGLLNGLMPCGPLQAMQLYALGTGSFVAGAVSMFVFSLGTVPLLFAFGAFGSMLSSKSAKNMIKCSAALVIVLGVVMLNRGMAFTGMTLPSVSAESGNSAIMSTVAGEEQQVTTSLDGGRYSPIAVQAGVPVKWTIEAGAEDLNGCNREMIIPEYNIQQELQPGENVIEFTPTKTGTFGYSCWMGMVRSSITVVEDIQGEDAAKAAKAAGESAGANTGGSMSCCAI